LVGFLSNIGKCVLTRQPFFLLRHTSISASYPHGPADVPSAGESQTVSASCSDEERDVRTNSGLTKIALSIVLLASLLLSGSVLGFARDKNETIDATAWGTSTQMGRNVGITIIIYQYSTPEDQDILMQAFQKSQNQGLVNALEKMKAVGHISITGTLGYDLSFIKLIQTPTGRTIRFVTNRPIRFGEAYYDTQSSYYNLTAGEINIDTQDKSKSSGVLYPAAQLAIGDDGQLTLNLNKNPWRLGDIIDWAGTPGEN